MDKFFFKNEVEMSEVEENGKSIGKQTIIYCENIILNIGGT